MGSLPCSSLFLRVRGPRQVQAPALARYRMLLNQGKVHVNHVVESYNAPSYCNRGQCRSCVVVVCLWKSAFFLVPAVAFWLLCIMRLLPSGVQANRFHSEAPGFTPV